jgi:hypothetical protein
MSHLSTERIAELSRGDVEGAGVAGGDERNHLDTCDDCRAALRRDQALGQALRAVPWPVPPASFVAAAQARFAAARRAHEVRRHVIASVGAAALTLATLMVAATAGLVASKQLVLFAALRIKDAAVALDLASTLMGRNPIVPLVAGLLCVATLVLSMGAIARLARAPVEAK